MTRPPMSACKKTGRPFPAWDLESPEPVPKGYRYVPGRGLVAMQTLYEEDRAKPGRPLQFTLEQAVSIKDDYWYGRKTGAALAREWKVTAVTIWRIAHSKTYWYA